MQSLISNTQRNNLSVECPNWHLLPTRDALQQSFVFKNFKDAFSCMSEIAVVAEELNHHPEWFNVWNRLEVTLSTHDSGGLTLKDIQLAQAINLICQKKLTEV
jgi:4a-hydroxytetrahydrobiopterin dehydratase